MSTGTLKVQFVTAATTKRILQTTQEDKKTNRNEKKEWNKCYVYMIGLGQTGGTAIFGMNIKMTM